jgi:hypothetical protein
MAVKYIPINSIVAITGFSKGLQESMARDFVSSGYSNTAPLMGKTEADTSKNIQNKVDGFSSGKNTYLQANQLAKIIHQYSSSVPRKRYTKRTTTASMPSGDLLKDCSGWSITKKTLDDGRVVYNADIKADTPKNKGDWAAIKGDVYVETGFKWNFKFQKFERWGQIENESEVIEKLCEVLAKYYERGEQPAPSEEPKVDPSLPEVGDRFFVKTDKNQRIYEIMKMEMGTVFVQPDGSEWDVPYSFADAKNNFAEGRWVKIVDEEAEKTPAPEAPKKSKEDIEKAIKGLQFLADKGNEKAKKAIIGLKILLNK